jgi:asparagine synthase (glutamine-hydrolysing)
MMSDVPLGAFLSGGIDSSAVVAAMSECSSAPVKTFSIGFEEDAFNELPHARLVAERYATDHHEFVVKPDAVAILPDLVWHYNEPYADSSALPTYYLAKLARQHVTVALNGDGGDENFAGYERYRLNRLAARYDRLPPIVRRLVEAGARLSPAFGGPTAFPRRAKRFLADAHEDPRRRYGRWLAIVSNAGKARLYTREFSEAMRSIDSLDLFVEAYATTDASDVVDATLGADVASYLPDDLLVKVDIATMAHGLEARSPMVDHLFMEFAASIPPNLKLHGGRKKHIFKQAIAPLLPAQLLDRPKQGFAVPLERWFRTSLREMTYDTLLSRRSLARGLFRREALARLLDDHVRGRAQWHPQLWGLLVLELWFERFTDGDRETAGDPARHA